MQAIPENGRAAIWATIWIVRLLHTAGLWINAKSPQTKRHDMKPPKEQLWSHVQDPDSHEHAHSRWILVTFDLAMIG